MKRAPAPCPEMGSIAQETDRSFLRRPLFSPSIIHADRGADHPAGLHRDWGCSRLRPSRPRPRNAWLLRPAASLVAPVMDRIAGRTVVEARRRAFVGRLTRAAVAWHRLKNAPGYRVICGDLSIKDATASVLPLPVSP